jgi:PAS domain S-box-containing protein
MFVFILSMMSFALWYTCLWNRTARIIITFLAVPGLAILVLIATNGYHHLFYPEIVHLAQPLPHFSHTGGIFYLPAQLYGVFLLATINLLLLYWMISSPRSYGMAQWLILIGALSPLTGMVLYHLGIRPFGFINLIPFSLIITVIALTIALVRYHLYTLKPIAYRNIINEIPAGILLLDENNRVIEINQSAAGLLGISEPGYSDTPLNALIPADHPVFSLVVSPPSMDMEFSAGEKIFHLTKKILTGEKGTRIGVLLLFTDITRQKADERIIQENEARYKLLLDNVADLIWQIDSREVFTYASPSWTRILGYRTDQVIGHTVREFIYPDDIPLCEEYLLHSIQKTETRKGIDYRVIHADGSWHWHHGSLIIINEDDREHFSVIGTSRDINDIRIAEASLKNALRQLNLLTSITRHDIINAIQVMEAYLDLAKDLEKSPDIERILQKFENLVPMIHSQIEFTRIYENLGSHDPVWHDMTVLMEMKKKTMPELVASSDCNFEIFADPMLGRVFDNLIDNSLRHGDHVTRIELLCSEKEGTLHILYRDNGAGIPRDEKPKIFERGYGQNTGMGLFLVREVLQLTGITIEETGSYGTGAVFEITVPADSYRRVKLPG